MVELVGLVGFSGAGLAGDGGDGDGGYGEGGVGEGGWWWRAGAAVVLFDGGRWSLVSGRRRELGQGGSTAGEHCWATCRFQYVVRRPSDGADAQPLGITLVVNRGTVAVGAVLMDSLVAEKNSRLAQVPQLHSQQLCPGDLIECVAWRPRAAWQP